MLESNLRGKGAIEVLATFLVLNLDLAPGSALRISKTSSIQLALRSGLHRQNHAAAWRDLGLLRLLKRESGFVEGADFPESIALITE